MKKYPYFLVALMLILISCGKKEQCSDGGYFKLDLSDFSKQEREYVDVSIYNGDSLLLKDSMKLYDTIYHQYGTRIYMGPSNNPDKIMYYIFPLAGKSIRVNLPVAGRTFRITDIRMKQREEKRAKNSKEQCINTEGIANIDGKHSQIKSGVEKNVLILKLNK